MNLNCVNARARLQTESNLEAASREVERSFTRMQTKEIKADIMQRQIDEVKRATMDEHEQHLARLLQRKGCLERELLEVNGKMAEKKLLLQERTGSVL